MEGIGERGRKRTRGMKGRKGEGREGCGRCRERGRTYLLTHLHSHIFNNLHALFLNFICRLIPLLPTDIHKPVTHLPVQFCITTFIPAFITSFFPSYHPTLLTDPGEYRILGAIPAQDPPVSQRTHPHPHPTQHRRHDVPLRLTQDTHQLGSIPLLHRRQYLGRRRKESERVRERESGTVKLKLCVPSSSLSRPLPCPSCSSYALS